MRRGLAAALIAAGVLAVGQASAHSMPNSTVVLSPDEAGLAVAVTIPLSELEAALGGPIRADADLPRLEAYVREHVALRTGAQTWSVTSSRLSLDIGDHPALKATLIFAAPPTTGPAELRYDAVLHRVASHYALVYWQASGALKPLVRLQLPHATVALPR
jgi:hypothetical protein